MQINITFDTNNEEDVQKYNEYTILDNLILFYYDIDKFCRELYNHPERLPVWDDDKNKLDYDRLSEYFNDIMNKHSPIIISKLKD